MRHPLLAAIAPEAMVDPWAPWVAFACFLGILGLTAWLIRRLIRQAARHAAGAAERLGLSPAGLGYAGMVTGIAVRVMPNAARAKGGLDSQPQAVKAYASGEILIVATLPQPVTTPWWVQTNGPEEGPLRARLKTGDSALDNAASLLAAVPDAAKALWTHPDVQAAFGPLNARLGCQVEIDCWEVAVHSARVWHAEALVHETVALTAAIGKAAVALGLTAAGHAPLPPQTP